tara:strand:+ start:355 stop:1167 length:813 start_codon:yes stop_codon:yes gene_type:complete
MDLSVPQHEDQESEIIYKIEAIIDTYLKKEPIQASSLPETEKVKVETGKTYSVVWKGKSGNGHTKVVLSHNGGTWFIYNDHWSGLGVEPELYVGMTPKKLDTKYYSQRDNFRDSSRTCFSSSCAMLLETIKPGTLQGERGDDEYIKTVFSIGDTTEAWVQIEALSRYGVDARFSQSCSLETLKDQIDKGIPVPIGILHHGPASSPSGTGHWICVYGYFGEGVWVMDPWGELDHATGYYISTEGGNQRYSNNLLNSRWTVAGDSDGWAIIV